MNLFFLDYLLNHNILISLSKKIRKLCVHLWLKLKLKLRHLFYKKKHFKVLKMFYKCSNFTLTLSFMTLSLKLRLQ